MASSDVFELFTPTAYSFLQLTGGTGGNKVIATTQATGILKYRSGLQQSDTAEAFESSATLHIRPNETFIATVGGHLQLVGHGIEANGDNYRISGVSVGTDYDTGLVCFYLCTLKKESLWVPSSPLV